MARGRIETAPRDDGELVRNILLALLSSLAKVEAQKISDRTKAGMARAKAKGIKIGRPRLSIEIRQQIARRMAKGETPYAIATAFRLIGIRWQGMQADFHWQIIKAKAGFKNRLLLSKNLLPTRRIFYDVFLNVGVRLFAIRKVLIGWFF